MAEALLPLTSSFHDQTRAVCDRTSQHDCRSRQAGSVTTGNAPLCGTSEVPERNSVAMPQVQFSDLEVLPGRILKLPLPSTSSATATERARVYNSDCLWTTAERRLGRLLRQTEERPSTALSQRWTRLHLDLPTAVAETQASPHHSEDDRAQPYDHQRQLRCTTGARHEI